MENESEQKYRLARTPVPESMRVVIGCVVNGIAYERNLQNGVEFTVEDNTIVLSKPVKDLALVSVEPGVH